MPRPPDRRSRSLGRWRIAGVLALAAVLCGSARADAPLLVFAAASLKTALDEVNAAFARSGGSEVRAAYAGSSALARQIEAGAPARVFISADEAWMDYLEARRLIEPASRRDLLGNRLVWIVPAAAARPPRLLDALGASGRLALADPQHVPAGKYARAALEALGLWPAVAARIAPAENVRAALALVARGEAPLGIVYRTDAQDEARVRIAAEIDPALHPPIVYPAALVRGAAPQASTYMQFLFGTEAHSIFARHGFLPR